MIRRLADEEWSANGSESPFCSVPLTLAEVATRLGLLDDNGNRVPMWYFGEREHAEAVTRDYAGREHRQAYGVESVI